MRTCRRSGSIVGLSPLVLRDFSQQSLPAADARLQVSVHRDTPLLDCRSLDGAGGQGLTARLTAPQHASAGNAAALSRHKAGIATLRKSTAGLWTLVIVSAQVRSFGAAVACQCHAAPIRSGHYQAIDTARLYQLRMALYELLVSTHFDDIKATMAASTTAVTVLRYQLRLPALACCLVD